MKRITTLLFIVLFIGTDSYSQAITVRDSGMVLISDDTVGEIKDLGVLGNVGQAQINGTWDLSLAKYNYPISYYPRQAPIAGSFPTADFMYKGGIPYNLASWQDISNYYTLDSTGIAWLGQNSFLHGASSRYIVTGNSNDSLIFPVQYIPFTPALKLMEYPITMGSVWSGNTAFSIQTYVYSAVGNLVNVPMTIKVSQSLNDSVVGWGKMRVRMRDSNKVSAYVPVLQVHGQNTAIDSFFINGSPAPDSILNSLGLAQAKIRTTYSTRFYRAGEIEPLLSTIFVFPYHQRAIRSTAILVRLPEGQASNIQSNKKRPLTVFPNPCRTRQISINWPEAGGAGLQFSLFNFAGSLVASGEIQASGLLKLADHMPAGFYSLSIMDSKGNKETSPLMLE